MLATLASEVKGLGPSAVLVHGFTQTRGGWESLIPLLPPGRSYRSVDLPGHGGSSDVEASFAETARLIGAAGGRADYIGYSMGGRLCLQLAASDPSSVRSLVLIGATPGIADAKERAARRARDEELARSIETSGVEAFLLSWLSQPMFAGLSAAMDHEIEQRKANNAAGLARSLRDLGTGRMGSLWDALCNLHLPVLILAGEQDQGFCKTGREMARLMPDAVFTDVPGAGHAAHLEQPDWVASAIGEFLEAHSSPPATS